jgi:nitric oxide reductase large subunit
MVVGLIARDLSWLSTALLMLLLAVVLYLWDFLTLVAKEEVWVPMNAERERLVGTWRMFGRLGFFSIVLDATVIVLVGVLTYWVVDQLRTSP